MNYNFKNKIFAISGEPVSGKGTAIKELKKGLKEQGYLEENIHLIATGHMFREYFEMIFKFIENIHDDMALKQLYQNDYLRKILGNKNYRQILINTVHKIESLAIDVNELTSISAANNSKIFTELRSVVDFLIDDDTRKLGEEINSQKRPNEVWIFDSRMAFHYIPDAFSVRLVVDSKEAARRLYNDNSRGKEDKYKTIEEAEKAREERRIGEIKRYKQRYGVDLEDKTNYNLILDTTNKTPQEIAKIIIAKEQEYEKKLELEER